MAPSNHLTPAMRADLCNRIFNILRSAAERGELCPSLREVGTMCGRDHKTITRALEVLENEGRIEFRDRTSGRRPSVYFPGLGIATATYQAAPKTTVPKKRGNFRLFDRRRGETTVHADIEQVIYGGILDDVRWLRHRGWVITKELGGYKVGNTLMGAEDIVAKAARERRLAQVQA
jgi:hypothetical protein